MWDLIKWVVLLLFGIITFFIVSEIVISYLDKNSARKVLDKKFLETEIGKRMGNAKVMKLLKRENDKTYGIVKSEQGEELFKERIKYEKISPELDRELNQKKELII